MANEVAILNGIEHALNAKFTQNGQTQKLWKNSYIKMQTEKRSSGRLFDLRDHVQAMIYSMLSSQRGWDAIEQNLHNIDIIFKNFDVQSLKNTSPQYFADELFKIKCGNRRTESQMRALHENINKLENLENNGGIDNFYNSILNTTNNDFEELLKKLANDSQYKLKEMGIPLIAEYLRNAGYRLAKPDTHLKRILSADYLGKNFGNLIAGDANDATVLSIVRDMESKTNRTQDEIDYLLWTFCADKYGAFCKRKYSKQSCDACTIKQYCHKLIDQKKDSNPSEEEKNKFLSDIKDLNPDLKGLDELVESYLKKSDFQSKIYDEDFAEFTDGATIVTIRLGIGEVNWIVVENDFVKNNPPKNGHSFGSIYFYSSLEGNVLNMDAIKKIMIG